MSHLLLLAQQMTTTTTNTGSGGAIFAGVGIVFLAVVVLASIFWIWMLIDCLVSNKPIGEKIIWLLVIFFLHLLGALIYFFVGRSGRTAVV